MRTLELSDMEAEVFTMRSWRAVYLEGQEQAFVWEGSRRYLICVPASVVQALAALDCPQPISLEEALRRIGMTG